MIVVNQLTKGCVFELLTSLETKEIYEALNHCVFYTQGIPDSMVSDRGSQFISCLWRQVCQWKGIRLKYLSAHHPETDGQIEIINKLIKIYLRNYVNWTQDN
jgi:transposase InsO family protein